MASLRSSTAETGPASAISRTSSMLDTSLKESWREMSSGISERSFSLSLGRTTVFIPKR